MNEDEKLELEFLRFFYSDVDTALGPASDDIYESIKQDWKKQGNKLPKGYGREDAE
jgi:hypothetical protein